MVFAVDSLFLPHTTMALNKSADCIEICKRARWLMNKTATKACSLSLHCWSAHKEREREGAGHSLLALFCLQTRLSPAKLSAKCIYEIICSHVHTCTHTPWTWAAAPAFLSPSEREMPIKYSQPACNFPQQQLVIFVAVRAALEEFLIPPAQVPERVEKSHG